MILTSVCALAFSGGILLGIQHIDMAGLGHSLTGTRASANPRAPASPARSGWAKSPVGWPDNYDDSITFSDSVGSLRVVNNDSGSSINVSQAMAEQNLACIVRGSAETAPPWDGD